MWINFLDCLSWKRALAAGFLSGIFLCASGLAASAETRIALIIGNGAYQHIGPLKNARNDAVDISARLGELGFDVVNGFDLKLADFRAVLDKFRRKLRNADVAVLFYAGHGIAVGGINYIIPVDARMAEADRLDEEGVRLNSIRALMDARPRTNILIFDACRNDPFTRNITRSIRRNVSVTRGWVPVAAPKGTYISFSTKPGDVALDGEGRNSPFTKALLKHISTRNLDVQAMMRRVRRAVLKVTNNKQVPWERSSLIDDFAFASSSSKTRDASWITTNKPNYRKGDAVQLFITPPKDCRLTLLNVDDGGTSCMLFPHPQLADTVLKAGERTVFPPKGELRLERPGKETFIAMCNASPTAKQAASRQSKVVDCSVGSADTSFNDRAFEVATFDFSGKRKQSGTGEQKKVLLRSSVTVQIAED